MSRQYDAKQHALKAYPTEREAGARLLLDYLEVSEKDFIYEEGMTPEEYIYGKNLETIRDAPAQATESPHLLELRGLFKDCGDPPFKSGYVLLGDAPAQRAPTYHELLTRLNAIQNLADAEDIAEWLMPMLVSPVQSGQNTADEIKRLNSLVEQLRTALKPFTCHYSPWMDEWADHVETSTYPKHTFGDVRRAIAALSSTDKT